HRVSNFLLPRIGLYIEIDASFIGTKSAQAGNQGVGLRLYRDSDRAGVGAFEPVIIVVLAVHDIGADRFTEPDLMGGIHILIGLVSVIGLRRMDAQGVFAAAVLHAGYLEIPGGIRGRSHLAGDGRAARAWVLADVGQAQ